MAAAEKKLGLLHEKVTDVLLEALDGQELEGYTDPESGEVFEAKRLPPSAAIIAAATKFLKDNEITCTPGEDNALGDLQKKMEEKRASRADRAAATNQTAFLNGLPN